MISSIYLSDSQKKRARSTSSLVRSTGALAIAKPGDAPTSDAEPQRPLSPESLGTSPPPPLPSSPPGSPPPTGRAPLPSTPSMAAVSLLQAHDDNLPVDQQAEMLRSLCEPDDEGRTRLHRLAAKGEYEQLLALFTLLRRFSVSIEQALQPHEAADSSPTVEAPTDPDSPPVDEATSASSSGSQASSVSQASSGSQASSVSQASSGSQASSVSQASSEDQPLVGNPRSSSFGGLPSLPLSPPPQRKPLAAEAPEQSTPSFIQIPSQSSPILSITPSSSSSSSSTSSSSSSSSSSSTTPSNPPSTPSTTPPSTPSTNPPSTPSTTPPSTNPPSTNPPSTNPPSTTPPSTTPPSTTPSTTPPSTASTNPSSTTGDGIVRYLVNLKDKRGWTCCHVAAAAGEYRCCLLLVQVNGVDVNMQTVDGSTVLHYLSRKAPAKERKDAYSKLLQAVLKAADVDITNCQGETALHSACLGGNVKSVKQLLFSGCQTDSKSRGGMTPLSYAVQSVHNKLVRYLVDWTDPRIGGLLQIARGIGQLAGELPLLEKRAKALDEYERCQVDTAVSDSERSEATEKFLRTMTLLPGERVLASFICAGCTSNHNFSRHGRLYLTDQRLYFACSLLLADFRFEVAYADVRSIRPECPDSWVPNSLWIGTKRMAYTLSQFMSSRNRCYDLLYSLWLSYQRRRFDQPSAAGRVQLSNQEGHFVKPAPNASVDLSLDQFEEPYVEPPPPPPLPPSLPSTIDSLLENLAGTFSPLPTLPPPPPPTLKVVTADDDTDDDDDDDDEENANDTSDEHANEASNENANSTATAEALAPVSTPLIVRPEPLRASFPRSPSMDASAGRLLPRPYPRQPLQRRASRVLQTPRAAAVPSPWSTKNIVLASLLVAALAVLLGSWLAADDTFVDPLTGRPFDSAERTALLAKHVAEMAEISRLQQSVLRLRNDIHYLDGLAAILQKNT